MAQFNIMSITNKGKNLYAKAQAGTELHFTKMQVGSGLIGTQNPETLLSLIAPKFNVGIQSITPNTEAQTATISGMIDNSAVTDSTYICEIGLFAQDPDDGEILYAYATAGNYGDYMAPATSGAYSWNYQVIAAVGNAANVTVQLSNLTYDYGVISTNTTLLYLKGGNQKEINKSIDDMFRVYTTTNSGNVYSISASNIPTTLPDGYPICLKINTDSTNSATIKINNSATNIPLKKANGTSITNLKKDGIYSFRYNSTTGNFILQGEGGGGTATPDKILAPYTATTDSGDVTGTILSKSAQTYQPSTTAQTIAAGQYLAGIQTIAAITGTATDVDVVSGKTYNSAAGILRTGTATIESLGGYRFISGTATVAYAEPTSVPSVTATFLVYLNLPQLASYSKILMFKASGIFDYKGTLTNATNGDVTNVTGTGKTASCVHVDGTTGKFIGLTPNLGVQQGDSIAYQESLGVYDGNNYAYDFNINKIYVYRGKVGSNSIYSVDSTTYNTTIQWYALVQ